MQDAGIAVLLAAVQEAPALPQRTECAPLRQVSGPPSNIKDLSVATLSNASSCWTRHFDS
jgi:hypothetical protein